MHPDTLLVAVADTSAKSTASLLPSEKVIVTLGASSAESEIPKTATETRITAKTLIHIAAAVLLRRLFIFFPFEIKLINFHRLKISSG